MAIGMLRIYVIDGVGGIEIKDLERGDITVRYGYTEAMHNIMYPIVQGRGRFDDRFKNWIVFSQRREEVLKALDGIAKRVD
ncbi:hypothetical protein AB6Q13_04330 [Ralstonia solanacearum]|uniref:Uncharacterized protein n=1 Tax=Ralstonia solanacearum TaxID=305 RepID=A0AAW5ZV59_RALSL|nr:hypothetical protein [Ralstonia solanacearum]MDB0567375.1 hypothetical protein [Ralstonia solanacearum]MDB0574014.1 hypothetical protein [Ralstonia solanacearum]MDB0577628.1 hypothetical protein [Ralstonia solanacearum]OAI60380.1 hypothetical protein RSP795_17820 [Ralstonia solanacearum]